MFRFRKYHSFFFPPFDIEVEVPVSQLDENGNTTVSFACVSAQSVIDSLPSPSEMTIANQISAGTLNPINLDSFTCDNLDDNSASNIINSLTSENHES